MRVLLAVYIMVPILFLGTASLLYAHDLTGPNCNPGTSNFPSCVDDHEHGGLRFDLESPLSPNIITFEDLLINILNVLLVLAVPIIVFFLIFAGFTYVTAQGNPEKIKTATRSLTYAIIGGVLILGGVAISEIIASVVESFRN